MNVLFSQSCKLWISCFSSTTQPWFLFIYWWWQTLHIKQRHRKLYGMKSKSGHGKDKKTSLMKHSVKKGPYKSLINFSCKWIFPYALCGKINIMYCSHIREKSRNQLPRHLKIIHCLRQCCEMLCVSLFATGLVKSNTWLRNGQRAH